MRSFCNEFLFLCIISSFISCNLSLYHGHIACIPVGKCKCEFPDGLGVDLNPLTGSNFSIPLNQTTTLLYYPCSDVPVKNGTANMTLNECEAGASLCLLENKTYLNFGSLNDSHFVWERINDEPILVFNHSNKIIDILLDCDNESKNSKLTHEKTPSAGSIYTFTLTSNLACVGTVEAEGHSVFSTLFIILLFLFLVYFFGGFCVLRFIRGARGWEAIPNGEFWKSVIGGTKKTFFYVIHGCKQPEVYDTI